MRSYTRWNDEAVAEFRKMADTGTSCADIADYFVTSRGAIYVKAGKLGITIQSTRKRGVKGRPATDTSGQRRFIGVGESDGPKVSLNPCHPALRNGSTIFGQLVIPAARAERLLKSGEHNRKIGARAVKGRWRDMPIYTLTLEERATCPASCLEWATCYGNNMGRAPRIMDDGTLTRRLWSELCYLSATHPGGFIVRLHVLGDFYSVDYVDFWRQSLAEFQQLHVFGFTARQPSDPIGRAVLMMMQDFQDQCLIRVSAGGKDELCSEVVDNEAEARGIVCPAEKDAARCCATCGLCWSTARTITFLRH